jgi:hypothetical protein
VPGHRFARAGGRPRRRTVPGRGDADGDGRVDAADLVRFAGTFGKRAGDPGYLWYLDYDGDGRVEFGDFLQVLRRLGR